MLFDARLLFDAWYDFACGAALVGRLDEALNYLGQVVDHGSLNADMATDNDLKSLHGDARFEALVAKARQAAQGNGVRQYFLTLSALSPHCVLSARWMVQVGHAETTILDGTLQVVVDRAVWRSDRRRDLSLITILIHYQSRKKIVIAVR